MTDLTAKIAALPEWAERVDAEVQPWQTIVRDRGCALARLALAREIIRTRVQIGSDEDYEEISALLAALEEPK